MEKEIIVVLGAAILNFGAIVLGNKVTLAIIKRDIEELKKSDTDQETRLRACENYVLIAEALKQGR